MYEQDPPFAVQIELVEGCPLRCQFCGLNGIRGKENDYKFMEVDTLKSLLEQMTDLRWNPRVEFAVHGEPSMHPHLAECVGAVRDIAPSYPIMITSNGAGFLKKPGPGALVALVFRAGLDVLALDDYDGVGFVPKIRGALRDRRVAAELEELSVRAYEYPSDPEGNPHRRVRGRRLVYVEDISHARSGTHATLNNHAGAGAPPLEQPMRARCAKPFRELTVRWDGSVAVCCNDWRGEYKCGNVATDGLVAVWNGPAMQAARAALYHGRRDLVKPCSKCDAVSYRVGLLPDKKGVETLPMPGKRERDAIAAAERGPSYTAPVKREWEK